MPWVALFTSSCDPGLQSEQVYDIDSETIRLTNSIHFKSSPSWSPDGKHIAYIQTSAGTGVLRLTADFDRQVTPILKEDDSWTDPTMSPDGTKIAYVSETLGFLTIRDLAGNMEIALAKEVSSPCNPVWSPDGNLIAFNSRTSRNSPVFLVSANGGAAQQVTEIDSAVTDICSSFSADGETIALESNRSGNWEIWTVNVHTRELRQLTFPPRNKHAPVFSPAGDSLAYATYEDTCSSHYAVLYLMPASGGPPRKLAVYNDNISRLLWSPDGSMLAVDDPDDISVIKLSTGKSMKVDPGEYNRPTWSPDSKSLFVSKTISNQAVFMVSVDDHHLTKLSPGKIDTASFPVWLNEQEVAFVKNDNLWKLRISGGQAERLTKDGRLRRSLDISPDRTRFCFDNTRDIFMQSVNGDPPVNLTEHITEPLINATWSHDGKQIACYAPMGLKIFALVSEKLVERKLMPGVYDNPAWSANSIFGDYLAFDDYRASGIGIAALNDLKPKLIISRAGAASWSPDGTKLVYLKDKQICVSRVFDDIR